MRRFDKKKSIKKANLLAEQRYLKDKLNESFHDVDGTPIGVDRNHMPIQKEEDVDFTKHGLIKHKKKWYNEFGEPREEFIWLDKPTTLVGPHKDEDWQLTLKDGDLIVPVEDKNPHYVASKRAGDAIIDRKINGIRWPGAIKYNGKLYHWYRQDDGVVTYFDANNEEDKLVFNSKEEMDDLLNSQNVNEPITEGGNQDVIQAVNMLVSHLYNADQSIDSNKAFEVLSKNPNLVNSLPLSPEDLEALTHLSTVFKNNETNEKLQKIINIVKSYVK